MSAPGAAKLHALVLSALMALPIATGCTACADGSGSDAGARDAGPTLPEGSVRCSAGHPCAVGTHCAGDTCAPGCFLDTSCRDDEYCWGVTETTTGKCRADDAPTCGDGRCDPSEGPSNCTTDCADCAHTFEGPSPCGDGSCPAGQYCRDPSAETCADGCTSQSHCGCGTTCVIRDALDVGTCQNPYANPEQCGNDMCDTGETLQNCPEDCQDWAQQCSFACELLDDDECFDADADAAACYQRCDGADAAQQETFASCVGTANALCPLQCLDGLPE